MQTNHRNGQRHQMQDREVLFRIQDVYVPEATQILVRLHGRDLLRGRVVDFSDRGEEPKAFAVVEVAGLGDPVVVPVSKIMAVEK